MPVTNQLAAHLAVRQLDELRKQVVRACQPALDLCITEARERNACKVAADRLARKMGCFRSLVLALDDAIVALRHECGTDRDELPPTSDEVDHEADRLHEKHHGHRRKPR